MAHGVARPARRRPPGVGVAHVADARARRRRVAQAGVAAAVGDQRVEHHDVVARLDQQVDDVGADEAGAAGDQARARTGAHHGDRRRPGGRAPTATWAASQPAPVAGGGERQPRDERQPDALDLAAGHLRQVGRRSDSAARADAAGQAGPGAGRPVREGPARSGRRAAGAGPPPDGPPRTAGPTASARAAGLPTSVR